MNKLRFTKLYLSLDFCRPTPLLVVHTGLHTTVILLDKSSVQSWIGDLSSPLGVRVTDGVRELDVVPTVAVLLSTLVQTVLRLKPLVVIRDKI